MMTIREENDARRAEFCRPLPSATESLFYCELGTLGCTEGHGDWEIAWVKGVAIEEERRLRALKELYPVDRLFGPMWPTPWVVVQLPIFVVIVVFLVWFLSRWPG